MAVISDTCLAATEKAAAAARTRTLATVASILTSLAAFWAAFIGHGQLALGAAGVAGFGCALVPRCVRGAQNLSCLTIFWIKVVRLHCALAACCLTASCSSQSLWLYSTPPVRCACGLVAQLAGLQRSCRTFSASISVAPCSLL